MRKRLMGLIAVILALGLLAAACGDDDSESGESLEAFRTEFLSGCTDSQNEAFCNCVFDELQNDFTLEELVAVGLDSNLTNDPPEEFITATIACLDEADLGG